eukprot:m.151774 g.151774  ORF g.151774 m.151774 type:complete len:550 (-) comp14257_c0_seq9:694-2343(-)
MADFGGAPPPLDADDSLDGYMSDDADGSGSFSGVSSATQSHAAAGKKPSKPSAPRGSPSGGSRRHGRSVVGASDEAGEGAGVVVVSSSTAEAAGRIGALGKKVRELQAMYNAEHARNAQLTKKVGELEYTTLTLQRDLSRSQRKEAKLRAQVSSGGNIGTSSSTSGSTMPSAPGTASGGRDGGAGEPEKVHEMRSEIARLRKEIQMAHRALEREIGAEIPVALILNQDSQWRGRAQLIQQLKAKVAELQKSQEGSATSHVASHADVDKRTRDTLRKLERQRKANLEQANTHLEEVQGALDELKKKYDGARARNNMLSREVKELRKAQEETKEQLAVADERVKDLEDEVEKLKTTKSRRFPERERLMSAVEELSTTCREQQKVIDTLQASSRANSLPSSRPGLSRSSSTASRTRTPSRPSSLHSVRQMPFSASSQRADQSVLEETQAMLRAETVEKDKYKELCAVLQRQVDEAAESALVSTSGLVPARQLSTDECVDQLSSARETISQLQTSLVQISKTKNDQIAALESMVSQMKYIFAQAAKKMKSAMA